MGHALIIADIEGIVDIYSLENIDQCCAPYTEEVSVYVQALLEHGVDKITICDAHDQGNLICASIIETGGATKGKINLVSRIKNISFAEKYDFAILVGFHGMEGSLGILSHTIRFDFKKIVVIDSQKRGVAIGEVELFSRWLGSYGIPVILVTGDREAVYEANCFNPYRQVCCVKSYYQTQMYDRSILYDKLAHSVTSALKLDRRRLVAPDNDKIVVEFHKQDVFEALIERGYKGEERCFKFSNCRSFVNDIYPLVTHLMEINDLILKTNVQFLKELRALAQRVPKEDLINSEIGPLLGHNLLSLDQDSRNKIMKAMMSMSDQ